MPSKIEEEKEVAEKILLMFKRGCRDKHSILRMASLAQVFRLLDQFSVERNAYAPLAYKTLIFSLIENHSNLSVREFILINF